MNYCKELQGHVLLRQAIDAGTIDYVNAIVSQRESVLSRLNGDGISWHNSFVRGTTEFIARNSRRKQIAWFASHREFEGLKVVGDYVVFTPTKGQNRLTARLANIPCLLLAASGSITSNILTLRSMGEMRQEFFINQLESVPRNPNWSLEHELGKEAKSYDQMKLLNPEQLRVLIVTEVYGPGKDRINVSLGIPDGQFNPQTGQVSLAESVRLMDVSLRELLSNREKRKNNAQGKPEQDVQVPVSRKIRNTQIGSAHEKSA